MIMIKKAELKKYRHNFNHYLIKNPNYFGNFTKSVLGFTPIVTLKTNTRYEELGCVSFNPETNELRAVVTIKKGSGYNGGSCVEGSLEYVRFFIDYERNGHWVDEGIAHFNAHDLQFTEDLCYGVKLSLAPKKRRCCSDKPVLPRVRAILSWNQQPPANNPNWLPVWGNVVEATIQLAPRYSFFCLNVIPQLKALNINLPKSFLKSLAETKEMKNEKEVALLPVDLGSLKKHYGGKVEEERIGFAAVYELINTPVQPMLTEHVNSLKNIGFNIDKIVTAIKKPNFNTSYEELKCVALNRQMSMLHGAIHIKRNAGYSGNLCEKGSREYIAFYMDFGAGWQYMGTTSVAVHDLKLPKEGLWYNAALPVSLTQYQQNGCKTGKAKVRGILSWNVMPTPNAPDHVAVWGDWEECHVELKPLPKNVPVGETVPVIDILGGMPVDLIAVDGLASGAHMSAGTVIEAPFDGRIKIQGRLANEPDSSQPLINRLKYRIMVKTPSFAAYQPLFNGFKIKTRRLNNGILLPQSTVTQTPDALEGWVDYYPDYKGADLTWEIENLLGEFYPTEEGLHTLYIELFDPVTAMNVSSNRVKFMVDKTRVEVEIKITSGSGDCGTNAVGEQLTGSFSIKDDYCSSMSLSVTPSDKANGRKPVIVSPPYNAASNLSTLSYKNVSANLPETGVNGTWELDTSGMTPCGYNIRIVGRERTIINSRLVNRSAQDIVGFCLKKDENTVDDA